VNTVEILNLVYDNGRLKRYVEDAEEAKIETEQKHLTGLLNHPDANKFDSDVWWMIKEAEGCL